MRFGMALTGTAAVLVLAGAARAEQTVGQPAGNFRATDADGKVVSLSDYRGKTVVLE